MAKSKIINTFIQHDESIIRRIYFIRDQKVMLDNDLADLYGIETKRLKEAVRRNIERFPEDFIFELTIEEANASRTQFAPLKRGGNIKYLPFAFTEQGVAMLSGVINSSIYEANEKLLDNKVDKELKERERLNRKRIGFSPGK